MVVNSYAACALAVFAKHGDAMSLSLLQTRVQKTQETIRTGECAESKGKSYFLGNEYVELGVSPVGDFGTRCSKPAGFESTRSSIGMTSAIDGFGGSGPVIDYFLPGTPEERFGIGYKIGSDGGDLAGGSNSFMMSKSDIAIESMSLGSNSVSFTGNLHGKLQMDCKYTLNPGEKHFLTEITMTNVASETLYDVRYHRSFDPDNTKDIGGAYSTVNTIVSTRAAGDDVTVVSASSKAGDAFFSRTGKRSTIFFSTTDDRAVAYTGGFSNDYKYSYDHPEAFKTPQAKGFTRTADQAIQITFGLGEMVAGASTDLTYVTALEYVDTEDDIVVIACDVTDGRPPVSSSGDPHMINIKGDAFDLYRPGVWEFLRVPLQASTNTAELRIMANVTNIGDEVDTCTKALYITRFTMGGNWVNGQDIDVRVLNGQMSVSIGKKTIQTSAKPVFVGTTPHGMLRLDMQKAGFLTIRIGSSLLAIGVDHKPEHKYLNFQATGLGKLGHRLGGLLGEDDHSWISMRPASCSQKYKSAEPGSNFVTGSRVRFH